MTKRWLSWVTILSVCVACDSGGDDPDGSAGSGGSSGAAGAATAGAAGTGATGGTAGSENSGGSAGSGGSASGGAGALMIPLPAGTIGAGVPCSGGLTCEAGTACCPNPGGPSCVSAFADCSCSVQGKCTVMGCDSAEDCPGGHCCALINPRLSPTYVATSCKPECESGERRLCLTDPDCESGEQCMHGSTFDWCF
jgi:hypothetical protein